MRSVERPDRDGTVADVVLGFDGVAGYEERPEPYFGALVGRYVNRIRDGVFRLDGRTHRLARNGGPHSLHGGERGFDKHVWEATEVDSGVRLSRVSPDGEEGFPGRLEVSATYTLDGDGDGDGALCVAYRAVTDAPTVVNPTHHAYGNLGGAHELWVAATHHTPSDATGVPTGEPAPVAGTRLDFRTPRPVGTGLDDDFVLDRAAGTAGSVAVGGAAGTAGSVAVGGAAGGVVATGPGGTAGPVAELCAPATGRAVTVRTTEPGLRVYAPDHLDGVALETQAFPDSPNRPEFPSTVLRPGEVHASRTQYGFGVR